jgi:hypothetical protein
MSQIESSGVNGYTSYIPLTFREYASLSGRCNLIFQFLEFSMCNLYIRTITRLFTRDSLLFWPRLNVYYKKPVTQDTVESSS